MSKKPEHIKLEESLGLKVAKDHCPYCDKYVPGQFTEDHVIPRALRRAKTGKCPLDRSDNPLFGRECTASNSGKCNSSWCVVVRKQANVLLVCPSCNASKADKTLEMHLQDIGRKPMPNHHPLYTRGWWLNAPQIVRGAASSIALPRFFTLYDRQGGRHRYSLPHLGQEGEALRQSITIGDSNPSEPIWHKVRPNPMRGHTPVSLLFSPRKPQLVATGWASSSQIAAPVEVWLSETAESILVCFRLRHRHLGGWHKVSVLSLLHRFGYDVDLDTRRSVFDTQIFWEETFHDFIRYANTIIEGDSND